MRHLSVVSAVLQCVYIGLDCLHSNKKSISDMPSVYILNNVIMSICVGLVCGIPSIVSLRFDDAPVYDAAGSN